MPKFKATHVVLALLCIMYFITYIDRVNIGTAAGAIQRELNLTNTQLGLVFSAFAYPYLVFQVFGGWVGDRFGARRTLFACGLIWAVATILTGLVNGLFTLFLARLLLGFGEGATFPTATRAMQYWTPPSRRGFAQGLTHAFARLGNAVTPPFVALLVIAFSWRGSFVLLGLISLVWVLVWVWYFRNDPKDHSGITEEELAQLPVRKPGAKLQIPWKPLLARMWPVTLTYFCYGWTLWLYLNWLPLFFKNNFGLDLKSSALFASGVFFAGVVGDTLGGVISDHILRRTNNVRLARLSVTIGGFLGAFLSLLPLLYIHDVTLVALCLSAGFFFAELVIGPMWSIPMDIAPKYSGTAAGLMNTGSAAAAIVSPLVAGFVIDVTANWFLPFLMSMGLLLVGAACAFMMHPEKPFEEHEMVGGTAKLAPAE
ncbi:major facilitator superfamily MFS_1 [Methylocella silvestris BL2]|uniref:Major facilitator superfamily MFS_1 n=1 Tax=Methylocella silvestris (strain DSM 15510 / CIP 108128 / LMG 27833 / NCIMB 13906 / BL2) TaxID=395965 RepID=B8ES82_METSB|nr:MFS transporter [Methylocella silvestris]ACK52297.1 major facilitator superfamily MFS_1 [Methylocella silvestris BL2]